MFRVFAQPSVRPLKAILYSLAATLLILLATSFAHTQTFRGGINGSVVDNTGAAIMVACTRL
jgi:hypothetical protein